METVTFTIREHEMAEWKIPLTKFSVLRCEVRDENGTIVNIYEATIEQLFRALAASF